MDDLSLDMNHELELTAGHMHNLPAKVRRIMQEGMLPDETGNMGKRKRPMRGLRKAMKKRHDYTY